MAGRCRCIRSCDQFRLGDVFVWVPVVSIEYNLDCGTKSLAPRGPHLLGNTLLVLEFGRVGGVVAPRKACLASGAHP